MNVDKRYYNKDRLFSYNEYLNFSISERGLGKTTSAKFWCIDDFIKTGHRFVWLRRYNSELSGDKKAKIEGCVKTWCDKIRKYYPKHKLEIKGSHCFVDGKDAGVFIALSTSQSMKSVDFPEVNKLIYDEFIIREGKGLTMLKDEVSTFLDLLSTIFRPIVDENGVEKMSGKVWLMANAITFASEYFFFWNIHPFPSNDNHPTYYHDKVHGIVVEQCANKAYREAVKQTRFGKLIAGTRYEKYAIYNKYLDDRDDFIGKKSSNANMLFNIRYEGQEWGVYADGQYVYITWKVDKTRPFYVFTKGDHTLDSILIKNARGTLFEVIVKHYQLGLVKCENTMIASKFVDFMKLFIVR